MHVIFAVDQVQQAGGAAAGAAEQRPADSLIVSRRELQPPIVARPPCRPLPKPPIPAIPTLATGSGQEPSPEGFATIQREGLVSRVGAPRFRG